MGDAREKYMMDRLLEAELLEDTPGAPPEMDDVIRYIKNGIQRNLDSGKESVEGLTRRGLRGILRGISGIQCISVPYELYDYACDVALETSLAYRNSPTEEGIEMPSGGTPFSPISLLEIKVTQLSSTYVLFITEKVGGSVYMLFVNNPSQQREGPLTAMGSYTPGKSGVFVSDSVRDRLEEKIDLANKISDDGTVFNDIHEYVIQVSLEYAFLWSLVGESKYTTKDFLPRQQRKRIAKASRGGMRHYNLVWNIGEKIKREVEKSDPKNATALHFRRSHWRHAKEGQPKAVTRNDAEGWWCLVSSCWVGHPAFGTITHTYTPKMPT